MLIRPDGTFAVFDQICAHNAAQILFPCPGSSLRACRVDITPAGRRVLSLQGAGEHPRNAVASQLCGEPVYGSAVLLSP